MGAMGATAPVLWQLRPRTEYGCNDNSCEQISSGK